MELDKALNGRSRRAAGMVAIRAVAAVAALCAALPALAGPDDAAVAPDPLLVEQGRRLFMDGVLPSGASLRAERVGNAPLVGKVAACAACHRRSGMGAVEGDTIIPPISGQALHAGKALRERVIVTMDPRRGRSWNQSHPPYDDASLLAAIRDGVHVTGRPMDVLMPRYAIGPREMPALNAFLNQLSANWSPGVTADSVRLATVIAPGVSHERRAAFLQTFIAAVDQKNSNTMPGHRHMVNTAEMMLRLERHWDVDIWELQGAPDTWGAQLLAFQHKAPAFALVSGLGDGRWDPVQDFCESERIPCWFPSVPLVPEGGDSQFYGLYFSQGVALEAHALASYLNEPGPVKGRVVQLLQDGDAARAGAGALKRALDSTPEALRGPVRGSEQHVLGADGAVKLREVISGLGSDDRLVLWLGPQELAALEGAAPPPCPVFVSTLLAQQHFDRIPAAWHERIRIVYPYELPAQRLTNMATFRSWIAIRSLPLVDEAMQSEVFFAVNYLQYTLSEMLDNVYRDYLVERGESMLRRRELARAEEETFIRQQGHPPAPRVAAASKPAPGAIFGGDPHGPLAQVNTQAVGVRQGTTIYPRLSLAPGQRYASKGAYIAKFSGPGGQELIADSQWIVP